MANLRKIETCRTNFQSVNLRTLLLIEGRHDWLKEQTVKTFYDHNDILPLYRVGSEEVPYRMTKELGAGIRIAALENAPKYNIKGSLHVSLEPFSENWKGPNAVYETMGVPYYCVFSIVTCAGSSNNVGQKSWYDNIYNLSTSKDANKGLLSNLCDNKKECAKALEYVTMCL